MVVVLVTINILTAHEETKVLTSQHCLLGLMDFFGVRNTQICIQASPELVRLNMCPFKTTNFKLFIKKQYSNRTFEPPSFPAQEIQAEKPASQKETQDVPLRLLRTTYGR